MAAARPPEGPVRPLGQRRCRSLEGGGEAGAATPGRRFGPAKRRAAAADRSGAGGGPKREEGEGAQLGWQRRDSLWRVLAVSQRRDSRLTVLHFRF